MERASCCVAGVKKFGTGVAIDLSQIRAHPQSWDPSSSPSYHTILPLTGRGREKTSLPPACAETATYSWDKTNDQNRKNERHREGAFFIEA